ncbi:hypothetical protein BDW69DRAFT_188974 [Aspergillus filifer]
MQPLIGHDLMKMDFENPEVLNAANPLDWGYHHGLYFKASNPNKILKVNGLICWAAISGDQMCGMVFSKRSAYWCHVRTKHEAKIDTLSRKNIAIKERVAGENALKRFVLERCWHNACFVLKPGRGLVNGLLDRYATACERIAMQEGPMAPAKAPPTPNKSQCRQHLAAIGAPGSLKARLQNEKAADAADKTPDASDDGEKDEEDKEQKDSNASEEDEEAGDNKAINIT